jgi:hypothetical protein
MLIDVMVARINQHRRGRSRETSPLRPQHPSTSYDTFGPAPPYEPTHSDEFQATSAGQRPPYSPPLDSATSPKPRLGIFACNRWLCLGGFVVYFILLAQAMAFTFFSNLPSKLYAYNEATARMRKQEGAMMEQAKHLKNESIALQNESDRLGRERLALESSTRKLEEEKDALELAIRRSELERSKLEQEKQLLKDERQSLAQEKEELKEEREMWEQARGAFWGVLTPAEDCRAYGTREYSAMLQNIPKDWTDMDACMNMPVKINGVSIRQPLRCEYVAVSPHIHGIWVVNWDQPDCKPWLYNVNDMVSIASLYPTPLTNANFKGCTNPGSGTRRLEAWVVGINDTPTQNWRVMCASTPITWNHITYDTPTHCEARVSTVFTRVLCYHPNILIGHRLSQWFGKKYALWDIPDETC